MPATSNVRLAALGAVIFRFHRVSNLLSVKLCAGHNHDITLRPQLVIGTSTR
jgi:hypothetical protein